MSGAEPEPTSAEPTRAEPGPATAAPVLVPDMSLPVARGLVDGVCRAAERAGVRLAAVVVDRGGNLVAAARMDTAQLGAMSLASDKAATAVAFGHPTRAWSEVSRPGGSDWGLAGTLGGRAIVFPGGLPVFLGPDLIGAVGVSGAAADVDEHCAAQAIAALGLASAR